MSECRIFLFLIDALIALTKSITWTTSLILLIHHLQFAALILNLLVEKI